MGSNPIQGRKVFVSLAGISRLTFHEHVQTAMPYITVMLVLIVFTHINITSGVCAGRPPQGGFITSWQSFDPADIDQRIKYTSKVELFLYSQCMVAIVLTH